MHQMLLCSYASDKKERVLIIEPGIGYRYEQENFSLITNYSILKPDITKPYIVSGGYKIRSG